MVLIYLFILNCQSILLKCPAISHIVCMEGLTKITTDGIPDNVELIPYSELEERGKQYEGTLFIYRNFFHK